MAVRATRHNGRKGKNGVYNPKHNDRSFDVGNSEHINMEFYKKDILWDCYHGIYMVADKDNDETKSFERIERTFYYEHYSDHVDSQNERNEKQGHSERNRTTVDLHTNEKTCPEETLYQFGTIESSVSTEVLVKVYMEFLEEFNRRFGEHVHVLNWSLHLDEATPHIHERHVFDCADRYGDIAPQQDKALEQLGIPLPYPDKKKGKNNNRKMAFDSICRTLLIDIAKSHNVEVLEEPIYGGREYLEKQDFILMKQSEAMAQKEQALEEVTFKLSEAERLIDEIVDEVYEKASEIVTETAKATIYEENDAIINGYKSWLGKPERKDDKKLREYAMRRLEIIQGKLRNAVVEVLEKVKCRLQNPEVMKKNKSEVKTVARKLLSERLAEKQKIVDAYKEEKRGEKHPTKNHNIEL